MANRNFVINLIHSRDHGKKRQNQLLVLFALADLWQPILLQEDALDTWTDTIVWRQINNNCNIKIERIYTGQVGDHKFSARAWSTSATNTQKLYFFLTSIAEKLRNCPWTAECQYYHTENK